MSYLRRFGHFLYDFVVGDDWLVAAGVIVALSVTWVAAHHGRNWFWLTPIVVLVTLAVSLLRVTRQRSR